MSTHRVNLGCGPHAARGWVNVDRIDAPGVDVVSDLRDRIALAEQSVDCVVAMHVLQDLAWQELPHALAEILRILRPGGWLRAGVPDLDRAIDAYRRDDAAWFYVPDRDARAPGAKLVTQIIWYGSVRTPCTFDFVREQLELAGFAHVARATFGRTGSPYPELASLDNRERESLYVEAIRPRAP